MAQKFVDKFYEAAEWVVICVGFLMVGFVAVLTFLYKIDGYTSVAERDQVFLGIGILIVFLVCVYILRKPLDWIYVRFHYFDKLLLAFTICGSCVFCLVFLDGAKILPSSDCKSVYDIAIWMSQGNMQAVVPEGSYLSLCPYQTGMIFIFEKIMRFFGISDPIFFQKINVCYVALAIVSGYGMLKMMTDRIELIFMYLVLSGTFFPLFINTGRVYGDVPSAALMLFATWMFFLFYRWADKRVRWLPGILGMGGTVLACTYRRNTLIYVIALTLAFGIWILKRFRWTNFLFFACVLVLSASSTKITQRYYEYYADNICGDGMPAVAYLAMGMQDSGDIPGGNNGFHTTVFMGSGYDREETVRVSKEAIAESLKEFGAYPGIMLDFYYRKLLLQWGNPTCGCFWQLGSLYNEPQSDYALDILYDGYGVYHKNLVVFMNFWQSTLYGIFCISLTSIVWRKVKKGKGVPLVFLVPLITFIGGFLFSMIWEAGPRYVMAYPYFLLPLLVGNLPAVIWSDKIMWARLTHKDSAE